jgi:signal transduction histidine kinase
VLPLGSDAEVTRLVEEQAALRRVATLVARRASPEEVFETVTAEVGRVLQAEAAGIGRYEPDGTGTYVGVWSCEGGARPAPVGTPFAREPGTAATLIFETHRPGRIESYEGVPGEVAAAAREAGWQTVCAPITVEGRLWGVSVASKSREPFPADTEDRLEKFTELVATAIANAESGEALTASRARIVTAADESRRRIERNLHDGAQQRLVSLGLKLRAVAAAMQPDDALRAELAATTNDLVGVLEDLQEISRGLHPAILSDGGLKPAFKELARRSAVPVKLDVRDGRRLPEHVEVAAYYVASEALTNAVKHAQASLVEICVDCGDDSLTLSIRDDGNGGAVPNRGSGLIGLTDRVEALGGTISVVSPPGAGTSLHVRLPIA